MLNIPLQFRFWLVQLALLGLLADAFALWSLAIYAMLLLAKLPQLYAASPQKLRPAWSITFSNGMALLIVIALMLFNLSAGVLNLMIHFLLLAAILRLLGFREQDQADFRQLNWVHYFLIACCFILNQTLAMSLLIFGLLLLQLSCHYLGFAAPQSKLPIKNALKLTLWFVPIWLALFLLFPRLSPLWQLPISQMATTGLGTELNPGSIEKLVESDELAFRVEFLDRQPSPTELYWRARIYDQFDGQSWQITARSESANFDQVQSPESLRLTYRLVAEPHQQRHLFSLGVPQQPPSELRVNSLGMLSTRVPLTQRTSYLLHSVLVAVPLAPTPHSSHYLQLPPGNPQTRQLAAQLAQASASPSELVEHISRHLQQGYRYTLTPPGLTGAQIDQFLFETRAGFCSHYASATTFILRAAGVPSRIVGGYLGGEWRDDASYLQVRQRDAHAWVEYLDNGQWQRFDPTLMVEPNRINSSLDELLSASELLRLQNSWAERMAWSKRLLLQLEDLDYYWSRWVLGFDTERQEDLLNTLRQSLTQLQQYNWNLLLKLVLVTAALPILLLLYRRWKKLSQQPMQLWLIQQLSAFSQKTAADTVQQFLKQLAVSYPKAQSEIEALDLSYQRLIFAQDPTVLPLFKRQTKQLVYVLRQQKK
jgi:transglutaminase-like putative cysteine protease